MFKYVIYLIILLITTPSFAVPNAGKPAANAPGGGGGGAGGAPTSAEYITGAADAGLSAERVCTDSVSIDCDMTVPGQANFHVNANAITDVRLRDSAGNSVIGRSAGTTGDPADITASADNQVLRRSGGAVGFGTLDAASVQSGVLDAARVPALSALSGAVTDGQVPNSITVDLATLATTASAALKVDDGVRPAISMISTATCPMGAFHDVDRAGDFDFGTDRCVTADQIVYAQDYRNNGTTTTAGIQEAVTAACAAFPSSPFGGLVMVPDGNISTTGTVTIPCQWITIAGHGWGSRIIPAAGTTLFSVTEPNAATIFRDFVIDFTVANAANRGIVLDAGASYGPSGVVIDHVLIRGETASGIGVVCDGCLISWISNSQIVDWSDGIYMTGTSGTSFPNALSVSQSNISSNGDDGIDIDELNSTFAISGSTVQSNGGDGIDCDASTNGYAIVNTSENHYEANVNSALHRPTGGCAFHSDGDRFADDNGFDYLREDTSTQKDDLFVATHFGLTAPRISNTTGVPIPILMPVRANGAATDCADPAVCRIYDRTTLAHLGLSATITGAWDFSGALLTTADIDDATLDDDLLPFDDADSLWTATQLGPALEELNDSINAGVPNSAAAKVHWSQLLGVPAGFADNTDDGGAGGEANTHSSDGGGLALTAATPKVGVDLRLVSLASADFDSAADLITIDATKWLTITAGNAAYQPLSSELNNLINNCIIENDATPIPDSCVGDGSDASGGGAPTTAKYIVAEADAGLSAEIAPTVDDTVPVSDSATSITFRALPDSDAATQKLQYDQATNTFSAGTDDDVPETGDFGGMAASDVAQHDNARHTGDVIPNATQDFGANHSLFDEIAAPGTPAAGKVAVYAKSGTPGELCAKDDAGTETCMSAGAGGGMSSFNVDGDNNTPETVNDGEEVAIIGGTDGIDTSVGATNTVTVTFDASELPNNDIPSTALATEVRSISIMASALKSDVTECEIALERLLNSGPRESTIRCPMTTSETDGFIYGSWITPDSLDIASDITFQVVAGVVTDNAGATAHGTIEIQCVAPDATVGSTWNSITELDVTQAAGDAVNDILYDTSAAVDLAQGASADCNPGDLLFFRYKVCDTDATPSTSCTSSAGAENDHEYLGFKIEYTSNIGDN